MILTLLYASIIVVVGLSIRPSDPTAKKRYIFFCAIILTMIAGLRHVNFGTGDTARYAQMFSEDAFMSYGQIWNSGFKDPFFHIFNKFIASIFGYNTQVMFFVYALIVNVSFSFVIYKESKDPLLSYVIFLAMGFFSFTMNGLRQGIALAFVFLSYLPLKEKKLIPFIILVFVGALFHRTALIFLLAYPLVLLRFTLFSIPIYAIIIIFSIYRGDIVLSYTINELAEYDQLNLDIYQLYVSRLSLSGLVQYALILVFALINFRKIMRNDSKAHILYSLLVMALIFQAMTEYMGEFFRVAMYFGIFVMSLLPLVVDNVPDSKKRIVRYGLIVVFLIYFIFFGAGQETYKFFWQEYNPW